MVYNTSQQYYRGIPLRLNNNEINYVSKKAKQYLINDTKYTIWIPNIHLKEDGTLKPQQNLNYIFTSESTKKQLALAGMARIITHMIRIKTRNKTILCNECGMCLKKGEEALGAFLGGIYKYASCMTCINKEFTYDLNINGMSCN